MTTRIKEVRVDRGLSQRDLAKLLGVTKQAVSHWERGGGIKFDSLRRVAQVLGCPVDLLIIDGT